MENIDIILFNTICYC